MIRNGRNLYCMPILETREIIYKEHRIENLIKIKTIINKYKELVLNILTKELIWKEKNEVS